MTVTIDDIRAAQERIAGQVDRTPVRYSRRLSQLTGAEIWIKFDNLHFTGSFKERGALNRLLQLTPDEKKRGVVAASAGNHAQALAYHGGRLGVPVTIVMPEGTPFVKVDGTRAHGANVVIHGLDFSGSTEEATMDQHDEDQHREQHAPRRRGRRTSARPGGGSMAHSSSYLAFVHSDCSQLPASRSIARRATNSRSR
jgi:threonine dehydratase